MVAANKDFPVMLLRSLFRDRSGAILVEFAIVMPLLFVLLLGIVQFGLIFYDTVVLTNGAEVGARELAISRLDATGYADTVTQIQSATSNFSSNGLTITLAVNGVTCASNTSCQTALETAYSLGQSASATVSYPCISVLPAALLNGVSVCTAGNLTAALTQPVQ